MVKDAFCCSTLGIRIELPERNTRELFSLRTFQFCALILEFNYWFIQFLQNSLSNNQTNQILRLFVFNSTNLNQINKFGSLEKETSSVGHKSN